MKKVLVFTIALFALGTSLSYAAGGYETFYKLNEKSTFNAMTRYLGTNFEQSNDLKYVFHLTEKKIKKAGNDTALEKAVMFNLANAKAVLTAEQYRKYLVVLNLSIQNNNNEFVAAN